ncbi:MAG: DUF4037 domain-containing protein [Phycisphaerae bacterium]|nr:DUF4037 domain-containing protein [Phycisphaerae bacterium]
MKGLELSERYFLDCGLPILQTHFPHLVDRMAAGLISCGSEVAGFDDEISRDHNWGPRFILFLSADDQARFGHQVQETLNRELPREYSGASVHRTGRQFPTAPAPVTTPEESCRFNTGFPTAPDSDRDWLAIPEHRLFEFTAGRIFHEPTPLISPLRDAFAYFPDMVWRKRLSFAWLQLSHCANISRTVARGNRVATHAFLCWALECCMRLGFLLNRRYAPFRKWLYHAFRELPRLPDGISGQMEEILQVDDLRTIESGLLGILDAFGRMANESDLILPQPLRIERPDSFLPFNFAGYMNAFHETLDGPLKQMNPSDGPMDLWGAIHLPLSTNLAEGIRWG